MARHKRPDIPLDAGHLARLGSDGPAALARRDRGFFVEQGVATAEMALVALVSLAGLWLWEAPPFSMLVLLLASLWLGIAGEALKLLLLGEAVRREVATGNADRAVWAVATAVMTGRQTIPADHLLPYQPRKGIVVDLLLGGVATGVIVLALSAAGHDIAAVLSLDAGLRALLLLTLAIQAAGIAWVVLRHRLGQGGRAPPRFAAGFRGVALFLLLFLLLAVGNEGRDLRLGLTVANGLVLGLLAPLAVLGIVLMRQETAWLRAWLAARD